METQIATEQAAAPPKKEPYARPLLRVEGRIEQLTQGVAGANTDGVLGSLPV